MRRRVDMRAPWISVAQTSYKFRIAHHMHCMYDTAFVLMLTRIYVVVLGALTMD
jgi:hypothetical protein